MIEFAHIVDELALAAAFGILAPPATMVGGWIVNHQRQKRALKRIRDDPYIKVGKRLLRVHAADGAQIFGACEIVKIDKAWLEVCSLDKREGMVWTVQEFEGLHPVIDRKGIKRDAE